MGSLFESGGNVPQALRAIDGDANGLQGMKASPGIIVSVKPMND